MLLKKKWFRMMVIIALLIGAFALWMTLANETERHTEKYAGVDLNLDVEGFEREDTYKQYLQQYESLPLPTEDGLLQVTDFTSSNADAAVQEIDGRQVVQMPEGSVIEWKVTVAQAGFYNIQIEYLTTESRGVDLERSLAINGEIPFNGASTMLFSRMWTDDGDVRTDNRGNQIRPSQREVWGWQTVYCKDAMGYQPEPYRFYLNEGENTLTFTAINEPMVIGNIYVRAIAQVPSYEAYRAAQPEVEMAPSTRNFVSRIEGEGAVLRSSPSLYARYDRSSPATSPSSLTTTVMNYIGGESWIKPGQWIEWVIDVPEDGFYHVSVKGRQIYQRGGLACRALTIDGTSPFAEAREITFRYSGNWELLTLSDAVGKAYEFFLTKGEHTIRLEATLGAAGPILQDLENCIYRLNLMYRKLLVLVGPNPDSHRDYNVDYYYPTVIDAMQLESMRLYSLIDQMADATGQTSDRMAVAKTLAVQLERFAKQNSRITRSFSNFKDNITSLGTAVQDMSQTRLDIDYLVISGVDAEVSVEKENWLDRVWHELKSSFYSFFVDYNMLGDVHEGEDTLEVWIVTGREQSTILKTMIDDTFTPQTGIPVNVKLVDGGALLSAVVAGNGPDVVVSTGGPVQFGLRGAAEDLRQFDDFDEVIARFEPSSYAGFEVNGHVYALPETQYFSVMFYRTDILEEMGLAVPETWEDLISMLPTIQGNNMSVGIPYPDVSSPDLSVYYSMLFQNSGDLYDEEGMKTLIDSEQGVETFTMYTSFYRDYGLPMVQDFLSRFRSGETPVGITGFGAYNTLMVSAPEIRGLWDFTLVPGTVTTDAEGNAYVDHSSASSGACCFIIATENQDIKSKAWEFIKWWTDADSQVRFGREIESVLGSSARYATANLEAFVQLSWSADELRVLNEQRSWAVGIPEIAGSYYTQWHITNAVRKVINNNADPRETLMDYARTINAEITKKRVEFGMPTE